MRHWTLGVAAILLSSVALACSSGAGQPDEGSRDAGQVASSDVPRPDLVPLLEGPRSPDGLRLIFATSDLSVGDHRVGFVLTTGAGLVRDPAATVSSFYLPDGTSNGEPRQTALAVFRPWPYGTRGLYTTRLTFDTPGYWRLDVTTLEVGAPSRRAQLFFEVREGTSAPPVGAQAVKSHSKTLGDVERITQLTTGSLQDPELYQTSIAEAAASGLPTVVVMASPAFCINAVCGPQVEVLKQLKDTYRGQANFVHVDFYDNPEEIQGDLDRARLSPTVLEWNLPSTEWSFVIDRRGVISARFESFATLEELEQALRQVL